MPVVIKAFLQCKKKSIGEWLHASVRTFQGTLSFVPGFPGGGSDVVPVSLNFQVPNLRVGWNDISVFPPDVVSAVWGLPIALLKNRASWYMVEDGSWRPVGRGNCGNNFDLIALDDYNLRASRGVNDKGA